jgi:hypothetical protein
MPVPGEPQAGVHDLAPKSRLQTIDILRNLNVGGCGVTPTTLGRPDLSSSVPGEVLRSLWLVFHVMSFPTLLLTISFLWDTCLSFLSGKDAFSLALSCFVGSNHMFNSLDFSHSTRGLSFSTFASGEGCATIQWTVYAWYTRLHWHSSTGFCFRCSRVCVLLNARCFV